MECQVYIDAPFRVVFQFSDFKSLTIYAELNEGKLSIRYTLRYFKGITFYANTYK